jgi:hypothetical protein
LKETTNCERIERVLFGNAINVATVEFLGSTKPRNWMQAFEFASDAVLAISDSECTIQHSFIA